jgi:SlyX protein
MPNPDLTDQRLTQLEIQLSFAEDLLETLNRQVAQQQDLIERLWQEVRTLRQQPADQGQVPFRSLRDELPPHY